MSQPSPAVTGNPSARHERAKKGAAARHTVRTYVRSIVARAGDLTPEDAALLRSILPPVPAKADGDAA